MSSLYEVPAIPKLCQMCGQSGHVQGPDCPYCCKVCGGEADEDGNCGEFGCNKTAENCPVGCDHKNNPSCAFHIPYLNGLLGLSETV